VDRGELQTNVDERGGDIKNVKVAGIDGEL